MSNRQPARKGTDITEWAYGGAAWQLDAVLVSQWLDDGVEENRDD